MNISPLLTDQARYPWRSLVRHFFLSFVIIMMLTGTRSASAQDRLVATVVLEKETAAPGTTFGVAVVLEIESNWHVYAGKGSPEEMAGYIPTEIALTLPRGWNVGPTQWPDVHEMLFGFPGMEELIRVYEGHSVAYIPVTIPADATPEKINIAANVTYLACDDKICEMPAESNAASILEVLAANVSIPIVAEDAERTQIFAGYTPPPSANPNIDNTNPDAKPIQHRVDLSLAYERGKLMPGDQVALAIRMNIHDTWHLQPGKGAPEPADYPTTLTFSLPNGWAVSAVQWPEAIRVPAPGGGPGGNDTIEAYDGNVVAYVGLTLPADLEPGDYTLTASLEYQACDPNLCEEPKFLSQLSTIEVVAPGSVIPPQTVAITSLFKEFDHRRAFMPEGNSVSSGNQNTAPDGFTLGWKEARWILMAVLLTVAMLFMIVQTFRITTRKGIIAATLICGAIGSMGGWALALSAIRPHGTPFTLAAFDAARARGDIVVVDFTAEWCLNCKTVEARILHHEDFEDFVNQPGVTFLVADITTGQEEGQKLKNSEPAFGGGIPILAIYHPDTDDSIVFQGIYTLGPVMDALHGNAPKIEAGQIFDFLGYRFSVGKNAWPLILLLAGVAGFFLNLTPCVLPVIPIKILSLQAHAKNPTRCFFLGVVFASGIVAMFAVLGILMGGLVVGMDKMQWGEFYQHWWVNLAVGLIILVMALGMFDIFTTRLPNWAYMFNPQSDTAKGSFFLGVLTAILATPCTGPLLGAALVWVATQPAWLAMTMFIVMGVGMALPYVILTANPKWINRIPKSGPGSELVKQVMGLLLITAASFFLLAVPLNLATAGTTETTPETSSLTPPLLPSADSIGG